MFDAFYSLFKELFFEHKCTLGLCLDDKYLWQGGCDFRELFNRCFGFNLM
jgi:hypothetical protein